MALRLVSASDLTALVRGCFTCSGLSAGDAVAIADVLVDADLRGTESHGISRAPVYLRRLRAGLTSGTERLGEPERSGPLCRLDAGHALGPAVGVRAVEIAAGLAAEHGIGLVAVGRSTHFGAAGYYARLAAKRGLVAIVASNGPAHMAPHGAAEPFLGTNAFAIGAPLGRHGTFSLDMASSVAARGKVLRAGALGEAIPPGLAIDAGGAPTTDAAAALAGAVLPLGGPKGSGLAFAVCLLAGVLAGADFDDELEPMSGGGGAPRPQNVGQFFLLLDPWRLASPDEATARVEGLVERLHALSTAEGFDEVLFPGERGDRLGAERRANGIPVQEAELHALAAACEESGMAELAQRTRVLAAAA